MLDLDDLDDLWLKQQLSLVAKRLGIEKPGRVEGDVEKGWRMIGKVKQGKKQYIEKLKKNVEEAIKKSEKGSKEEMRVLELQYQYNVMTG